VLNAGVRAMRMCRVGRAFQHVNPLVLLWPYHLWIGGAG